MEPGLIVNADDLGVDPATTQGIASAYQHGIVSSTSLMVTMPAVEAAVATARTMEMPVGLHIALTQGRAVAGPHLDRLVAETGEFKLRAQDLIRVGRKDTYLIAQIRTEVRAQLARGADFGMTLTHVDSHQHIHMNPVLFRIWEEEAATFGIQRIRFSREPLRFLWDTGAYAQVLKRNNLPKWMITRAYARRIKPRLEVPDIFFGLLYSGVVVKGVLLNILMRIPLHQTVEICVHPGLPNQTPTHSADNFQAFSKSIFRRLEHDALVDPEVLELIRKRGLILRSFSGKIKSRS